jgi:hypothetical protein
MRACVVCCLPSKEDHAMIELEFCGYASLPGSHLAECLDASGVELSVPHGGEAGGLDDADPDDR